jgi:signal transduction histidine kinase
LQLNDTIKTYLVDDDHVFCQVLLPRFPANFEVTCFHDGASAWHAALENPPDLVVTDISMPELDGIELLSRLKQTSPQTLVIILSGFGDKNAIASALRGGAFDFIEKGQELQIIDSVLHRAQNMVLLQHQLFEAANNARINEGMAQLGMMVASIVHEIKSPLFKAQIKTRKIRTALKAAGMTSLASDASEVDDLMDRVFKIIHSQSRLYRFSSDSRTENALVGQAVQDAAGLCESIFSGNFIEFKKDLSDLDRVVSMGNVELGQVLVNLMINASHAVEPLKEKWVHLAGFAEGNFYVLKVTDSGAGIERKVAVRMFDASFTTKAAGKGTGLGLSTSKRLIEASGGTIEYDSTAKNTCFVIKIPLAAATEKNPLPAGTPPKVAS